MDKFQIGPLTLLVVLITGSLAWRYEAGGVGWLPTLTGLVLLLILFAFDREGVRSTAQSLAFASACGFCVMLVCTLPFQYFGRNHTAPALFAGEYFVIAWIAATFVIWIIDRARMGRREQVPGKSRGALYSSQMFSAAPEPAAVPVSPVVATPVSQSAAAPVTEPISNTPQTADQAVSPPPPGPAITPVPLKPGKEVMIYVALLNEGMSVMRSVRAEDLGHDFYKILETMPEGETWEYQTGQIVRCQKRKLSTGKGLVAVAEAPRAQP